MIKGIMNKVKKYFLTSKSYVIDLKDCITIPSSKKIEDTVQNWANKIKRISHL